MNEKIEQCPYCGGVKGQNEVLNVPAMRMVSNYIEERKKWWGPEFAGLAGIDPKPEHNEIVGMSCYTMIYEIADNFRDGEFRDEIKKHFGVEE